MAYPVVDIIPSNSCIIQLYRRLYYTTKLLGMKKGGPKRSKGAPYMSVTRKEESVTL